ncbi:hypothetical protein L0152_28250 [bacterium]|nr:hypothetical protein [bacterium]
MQVGALALARIKKHAPEVEKKIIRPLSHKKKLSLIAHGDPFKVCPASLQHGLV